MNGLQQGFVTGHKVGCPFLHSRCTCGDAPTEMASLVQIKKDLADIQLSQQVLCERLDAIAKENGTANYNKLSENSARWMEWAARLEKKLDCLQGKELLAQFKAKPKRRKKRETQKGR